MTEPNACYIFIKFGVHQELMPMLQYEKIAGLQCCYWKPAIVNINFVTDI